MLRIGCHLSAAKTYTAMAETAAGIEANTLQFFARNPRGGRARALRDEDAESFRAYTAAHGISHILAHAPYTVNPCSSNGEVRTFAAEAVAGDLVRLEQLGVSLYNLHPGSHTGQGRDAGIGQTAEILNRTLEKAGNVRILLETMTGKGTEIGGAFEDLAAVIDRIEDKSRIGVCFDTCHVHDAGYDIVHDLDGVLAAFDEIVGLDRLFAVHLNDSQNDAGAKKDRHERIGEGKIGVAALEAVVRHPALAHLPFILETPNELEGYASEIRQMRNAARFGKGDA